MIRRIRHRFKLSRDRQRLFEIYDTYKDHTMIHADDYAANLSLCETADAVPGAVVECGVWRGGMIAGITHVLGRGREYVLCDSFEGLPPAREIDGEAACKWQQDTTGVTYHDNCAAPLDIVKGVMSRSQADRVRYVPGWFDQTLPSLKLDDKIAVLRLDGDWYDSTLCCLTNLAPVVAEGGLIVIDDYHAWDGCSRAVHDYLSAKKLNWRISQWQNRISYIKVPISPTT